MAQPFLGELKLMAFNFAPRGWALCNGQLLPINQNQALFSILGTTYGGNGTTNFQLPDLRGRAALGFSGSHPLGQVFGEENHTLTLAETPTHTHTAQASSAIAIAGIPGITPDTTKVTAQGLVSISGGGTAPASLYGTGTPDRTMSADTISAVGGSQPHPNQQPYLVLEWCIALQGIFPSRN